MRNILQMSLAVLIVLGGTMLAQQSGTINTLSVNPRQNQELTNTTGTETGQPSDAVPGSATEPNGLMPVTTEMLGSGSNGNMNQAPSTAKGQSANRPAKAAEQKPTAPQGAQEKAKTQK